MFRSEEQHLPQSTTTWRPESFCHLPQSVPDGKYQRSIFLSTCVLWGIIPTWKMSWWFFFPWCFSGEEGKQQDDTTQNSTSSSCRLFLYLFFFFLIMEVIERKTKEKFGSKLQLSESLHTKAFFFHLSALRSLAALYPPEKSYTTCITSNSFLSLLSSLTFEKCYFRSLPLEISLPKTQHQFSVLCHD